MTKWEDLYIVEILSYSDSQSNIGVSNVYHKLYDTVENMDLFIQALYVLLQFSNRTSFICGDFNIDPLKQTQTIDTIFLICC